MEKDLEVFKGIEQDFLGGSDRWNEMWNEPNPEVMTFPEPWQSKLDTFERIILIKAIRSDKVIPSIQKWIVEKTNEKFIIAPTFDLGKCYKDSTTLTPLIFVLSPGSDPIADLMKFAEEANMVKRIESISLGQG
jgi:dynein heavy chain